MTQPSRLHHLPQSSHPGWVPNKVNQPLCPSCHKLKATANCSKKEEESSTDFVYIFPIFSKLQGCVFNVLDKTKNVRDTFFFHLYYNFQLLAAVDISFLGHWRNKICSIFVIIVVSIISLIIWATINSQADGSWTLSPKEQDKALVKDTTLSTNHLQTSRQPFVYFGKAHMSLNRPVVWIKITVSLLGTKGRVAVSLAFSSSRLPSAAI